MEIDQQGSAGGSGGADGPIIIRNSEDLLAVIQKRNPVIMPFEYKGRMCVEFRDFYMAVCGIDKPAAGDASAWAKITSAASSVRERMFKKDETIKGRIVDSVQIHGEWDDSELVRIRIKSTKMCFSYRIHEHWN